MKRLHQVSIPTKAYIIAIDTPTSMEYAAHAVRSCMKVDFEYEIFKGVQGLSAREALSLVDPSIHLRQPNMSDKAACATASHFLLWKKIAENKECAIILEHDALLLHKPTFDIPDNFITILGYKYKKPWAYNHEQAGPPKRIHQIYQHAGAHSYALSHVTAQSLLDELNTLGVPQAIDNTYFMRTFPEPDLRTEIPMAIVDPICAMGWVRESTIWDKQPTTGNFTFLKSFIANCDMAELDSIA